MDIVTMHLWHIILDLANQNQVSVIQPANIMGRAGQLYWFPDDQAAKSFVGALARAKEMAGAIIYQADEHAVGIRVPSTFVEYLAVKTFAETSTTSQKWTILPKERPYSLAN
jgi:uncharacterized protein YbcC (UPF0753/DUF2309 family)